MSPPKNKKIAAAQPDLLAASAKTDGDAFDVLRHDVSICAKCRLGQLRTHAVFGEGNRNADLMFIGEAPGASEDETGQPFVGRAGQMLNRTLEANGIKREDVFVSNIVKCRPPENRDPMRDEIEACSPYLFSQIEMIQPAMVCALGRYAAATLLGRPVKITQEHGIWMDYRGRPFLIALHPSAAMRSPKFREQFEHDIAVLAERYHGLAGKRVRPG